ncbi:MAG: dipeptidase [Acidimicrobiia bacterium]
MEGGPSLRPVITAAEIHATLPVIDGHNDLPWQIRKRAGSDLAAADPRRHLDGYHTDYDRLVAGGVGGQFWSVYIPSTQPDPFAATLEQIDLVDRMVALAPDRMADAVTAAEVRAVRGEGRVASLRGAEGGHCIEGSLDKLAALHERGVRYLTLTHTETIGWADSATDEPRHGGLTGFGRRVVAQMNRLGMIVDISHVSPDTMRSAIAVSEHPVIASHSGASAIASHPRNVPDDVLELIAGNGGVVMVPFYPPFLVPATAARSVAMVAEERRLLAELGDPDEVDRMTAATKTGWDRGSVGDVVDHIEHIARVAGVDHVGLGSDFDGIDMTVAGLEDVAAYPAITAMLLDRRWSERAVRKVLGDNVLGVLETVTGG